MSVAEIKEVVTSFNIRSELGRVVVNNGMADQLEVHTVDQIRLCCNRAFLTFDSYVKHKEESPCCTPGIVLEPIGQNKPEDDEDESGFFPVIQSISSVDIVDPADEIEIDDQVTDDNNLSTGIEFLDFGTTPLVNDALKSLSLSSATAKLKHNEFHNPSWLPKINQKPSSCQPNAKELGSRINDDDHSGGSEGEWEFEVGDIDNNEERGDDEAHQKFNVDIQDGMKVFRCDFENCDYSAGTPELVTNHLKTAHDSLGKVHCHVCSCSFKTQHNLNRHLMRSHSERVDYEEIGDDKYVMMILNNKTRYKCRACSYYALSKSEVDRHIKAAHDPNGTFQCEYCTCCYKGLSGLSQHLKSKHSKKVKSGKYERNASEDLPTFRTVIVGGKTRYKCKTCGYSTPKKVTIRDHVERVHGQNGKFSCSTCLQQCPTKIKLIQHLKLRHNIHNSGNRSSNENCQELETLPDSVISFTLNGCRRHKCMHCDFYTNDMESVMRHVNTAHNSAPIFSCNACSCRFPSRKHLDHHIANIHPINEDAETGPVNDIDDEGSEISENIFSKKLIKNVRKLFQCNKCTYQTYCQRVLLSHLKGAHVPDGKFQCNLCPCRYSRRGFLKQHIRLSHSGKIGSIAIDESKKFKCQLCSYCSHKKGEIERHRKAAHVPGGKFPCPFCSCCYSFNANFSRHLRQSHPGKNWESVVENGQHTDIGVQPSVLEEIGTYKCDKKACSYTCKDVRSIKRHNLHAHNLTAKYPCRFCSCRFETYRSLSIHLVRQHGFRQGRPSIQSQILSKTKPPQQYHKIKGCIRVIKNGQVLNTCSKKNCVFRTSTLTQMKWHMKCGHSLSRKVTCDACSCRFKTELAMQKHYNLYHGDSVSKPVDQGIENQETIGDSVKNDKSKDSRMPVNERPKHKCPIPGCQSTVRTAGIESYEMKIHLRISHSPDARFKCTFCPCRYLSAKGLKLHLKSTHCKSKPKSSIDSDSKRKISQVKVESPIAKNRKENTSRLHKCFKCNYACRNTSHLKLHLKVAHVRFGPHKCTACSCRFATIHGLSAHNVRHREQNLKPDVTKEPIDLLNILKKRPVVALELLADCKPSEVVPTIKSISKGKKMYSCQSCDRTFRNKTSRDWHIKCAHSKWASNVKRYPCDLCPNVHDTESGLKIHRGKAHGIIQKTKDLLSSPEKEQYKTSELNQNSKSPLEQNDINALENKPSLFPCSKCNFATQDEQSFGDHIQGSHVLDGMKCLWCSCTFATKMNLVLHQMAQHPNCFNTTGVNWFQRKTGITKAGTKVAVDHDSDNSSVEDAHENNSIKAPYFKASTSFKAKKKGLKTRLQCHKCSFFTTQKLFLIKHAKTAHYKNGVACDLCPCKFASNRGMLKHRFRAHKSPTSGSAPRIPNSNQLKCETCLTYFDSDVVYNKHIRQCKFPGSNLCSSGIDKLRRNSKSSDCENLSAIESHNFEEVKPIKADALGEQQDNADQNESEKVIGSDIVDTKPSEVSNEDLSTPIMKKRFSPKSRPIRCINCGKICLGPDKLKTHQEEHHQTLINCETNSVPNSQSSSETSIENSDRQKCNECACTFMTEKELDVHKRKRHPQQDQSVKVSNADGEETKENGDVQKLCDYEEMEQNDGSKIYRCKLCEYSTEIFANAHSHLQTSHTDGIFVCDICKCSFSSQMNLFYHKSFFHPGIMKGRNGKGPKDSYLQIGYAVDDIVQCGYCTFSCITIPDLESHHIKCHVIKETDGESTSGCKEAAFPQITGINEITKLYMAKRKLVEKQYVVRKVHSCGAPFSDLDDSIDCTICNQKFKKSHWSLHMQLCHCTMKTSAQCTQCPCKYATKSALQNHVEWSHKLKPSGSLGSLASESDSKDKLIKSPIKCQKCGLMFGLATSLEVHQKVSHSIGKHKCVICSCRYTTLYGLDGHVTGAHQVARNLLISVNQENSVEEREMPNLETSASIDCPEVLESLENNLNSATAPEISSTEETFRKLSSPSQLQKSALFDVEMLQPLSTEPKSLENSELSDNYARRSKRKSVEIVKPVVRSSISSKSHSDPKVHLSESDRSDTVKIMSEKIKRRTEAVDKTGTSKNPSIYKSVLQQSEASFMRVNSLIIDDNIPKENPHLVESRRSGRTPKRNYTGCPSEAITEDPGSQEVQFSAQSLKKKSAKWRFIETDDSVPESIEQDKAVQKNPDKVNIIGTIAEHASKVIKRAMIETIEIENDDGNNLKQVETEMNTTVSQKRKNAKRGLHGTVGSISDCVEEVNAVQKNPVNVESVLTGRPPKRKSAERASKVIKDAMFETIEIDDTNEETLKEEENKSSSIMPPKKKNARRVFNETVDTISECIEESNVVQENPVTVENVWTERPPKRKSAERASKVIKDAMIETIEINDVDEENLKQLKTDINDAVSPKKLKRVERASKGMLDSIPETMKESQAREEKPDRLRIASRGDRRAQPAKVITNTALESIDDDVVFLTSTFDEKNLVNTSTRTSQKAPKSVERALKVVTEAVSKTTENSKGVIGKSNIADNGREILRPLKRKITEMPRGNLISDPTISEMALNKADSTVNRDIGRPPKRKSAETASKIIVDVMNEELNKKKLESLQKSKRKQWVKEFMKLVCSRCGSTFESSILLTTHFQSCQHRCAKFPCGICFNEFSTLLKLKDHLWNTHKPAFEKAVQPPAAPPIVINKPLFSAMPPKGPKEPPKPYSCSLCRKGLKDRKALILHMSVPHLYRCKTCPFVCETKKLMDAHKFEVHEPQSSTLSSLTAVPDEKNGMGIKSPGKVRSMRTCKCGTRFSKPSDYEYHKRECKSQTPIKDVPEQQHPSEQIPVMFEKIQGSNSEAEVSASPSSMNGNDKISKKHPVSEETECNESMICEDCGYLATSIEDARDHNNSVKNNESMICEMCAYFATSSCDLKIHTKENHLEAIVVEKTSELQNVESLEGHCRGASNTANDVNNEAQQPVEIEIEFHDNVIIEQLKSSTCDNFDNLAQEIEVRQVTNYEDIPYNGNDDHNDAVVLFNLSQFD